MSREILFKGKTCSGEWVEGLLAHKDDKWYISNKAGMPFAFEIRPETICQYTGLKDKDSKKVWENDIVKDSRGNLYKIFWQKNYYQFTFICIKVNDALLFGAKWDLWSLAKNKDLELHGSIFDNPELLKEGAENG